MIPVPAPPPPPATQPMISAESEASPSVTPEQKPTGERAVLESKLHPALLAAFDCWKKSGTDCKLAPSGKVEVQVWLTNNSGAVLEHLKAIGFTVSQARPKERVMIGHLPLDKLADLAKISAVRFVSRVRR
jgi:hypothetical protein